MGGGRAAYETRLLLEEDDFLSSLSRGFGLESRRGRTVVSESVRTLAGEAELRRTDFFLLVFMRSLEGLVGATDVA